MPLGRKHYTGMLILLFGVIGQVSMFNTFCHLHAPLGISYLRSMLGTILGLVVGLTLRAVVSIVLKMFSVKT